MQDSVFCVFTLQLIGEEKDIEAVEQLIDSMEIVRKVLEVA